MAKDFAKNFYRSSAWEKCRASFIISKHGLCERCGRPGKIVHHKVYLTPDNINDPNITLSWENLELVCATCHQHEHFESDAIIDGYKFNEFGDMVKI